VPVKVQPFLALNPIIFIVGSFRQIAISHQWPDLSLAATAIVSGLACFLFGSFVYLKLQNDFLDLL
jgi:ABC-type polysaccharide/polyol phosphate export permease